jgi:hypothetical protein
MGAGDLTFGISLEERVSGAAHKASSAVDKLSNDFKAAKSQLAFFQSQLNLAKQLGDVAGYDKFSEAVAKSRREVLDLGTALGQAPQQGKKILTIKDPAEIAHRALEGVAAGLKGMAGALKSGDAKGAIEGATESLAGLASMLDLVEPGLGQAAAAVVKLTGAIAAMTVGVIQSGVELALEVTAVNAQLGATFDALGKGPQAGKKTVEMLDDMSRVLPQSRDQLAKWTREIEKMGITDLGEVRQEILATASAQAILGEGGDAAYTKISRKVQDAIEGHHKLTIASKELSKTIGDNLSSDVAAKMGMSLQQLEVKLKAGTVDAKQFGIALEETLIEKGAGPLDKMWMKTSVTTDKLKQSFGELFADVDTKPITDAMRGLLVLFDQTTPSGQAMKTNITDAFNGIVKAIGWAITEGEVWFLEMEVWALSMELNLKPVVKIIRQIGAALEAAGQAVGLVAKPGEAPPPPPPPKSVAEMRMDAVTGLIPGANVGKSIGQGLVNGMLSMLGIIRDTGEELGKAGAQGARDGAQVKSPSRLTMQVGAYMAEGLAIGMTKSDAPANAGRQISGNAIGSMVGQSLTSPPANQNGGGGGVNISGLVIHITAPQGITDATGLSASGLVLAVEKLQLASGR